MTMISSPALPPPKTSPDDFTSSCHRTISALVSAFAAQDIDMIMSLFADNATYCDIRGKGIRGGEYFGKASIREAFTRQFRLMGLHTYEAPVIIAKGQTAFASWTLVLGLPEDSRAHRFDGIDFFELDEMAKVTLKKAWLKDQSRLASRLIARNPLQVFRDPAYALFGSAR